MESYYCYITAVQSHSYPPPCADNPSITQVMYMFLLVSYHSKFGNEHILQRKVS